MPTLLQRAGVFIQIRIPKWGEDETLCVHSEFTQVWTKQCCGQCPRLYLHKCQSLR